MLRTYEALSQPRRSEGRLRRWLRLPSIWNERSYQRRRLAELDDDRLRDIGLTPGEARRECAKPFWEA